MNPQENERSMMQRAVRALQSTRKKLEALEQAQHEPIAVVGMGCRFPGGGHSPDTFWQFLLNGGDAVTEAPRHRFFDAGVHADVDENTRDRIQRGGYLNAVDRFDAQFFRISPREARAMDPQQRILLETSWEALERAGYAPDRQTPLPAGVFVGVTLNEYPHYQRNAAAQNARGIHRITGTSLYAVAGRLSYTFGLNGPCMAIDTACSSSLVAVHTACQSLRNGECGMALAAGVSLILTEDFTVNLGEAQALSPSGRCKTFDAAADGYVRGEGCGVLVLKRLSDAQADGDNILALLRGSAVNQDGASSGFTVPNGRAQQALIRQALQKAQLKPDAVTYIEAHGPGTPLGDPIEIGALGAVFSDRQTPLYVGAVKTNVGHLEPAAGMAGLFKVILSMQHGIIPRNLHLHEPNPAIPWDALSIVVPQENTPWPDVVKVAGVSSFGVSGTNAHIVVEQAPPMEPAINESEPAAQLLTLSAQSEPALRELVQRYREHLATAPAASLGDICHTARVGRCHFDYRLTVTAPSLTQMQETLDAYLADGLAAGATQGYAPGHKPAPKLAFLFTGQGAQYLQMGRELYETQPLFRQRLDQCDAVLRDCLGRSLLELLYPAAPPNHNDLMESHPCGQAANFAIECALADLWRSWGVEPDVVLGHSLGDFAAAYTAGVLSLEDGLRLVVERGRLMETALGSMVSVQASEAEVSPFVAQRGDVTVGVINGPRSVVLSGSYEGVAEVESALREAGFKTRRLDIPVAAHSPMLDPVLDTFEAAVGAVPLSPPTVPVVSSMTGQLVGDELTDPGYWRQHLRNTVRFADSVQTLHQQGVGIFLEIGPQSTLLGMTVQNTDPAAEIALLPSLRVGQSNWQQMLESVGELYVRGVSIDWHGIDWHGIDRHLARRKVVLPTYPFQRQQYWLDPVTKRAGAEALRPLIDKRVRLPLHGMTLFEREFSVEALPALGDYRIYNSTVAPVAYMLGMVLSAAELSWGDKQAQLDAVEMALPLVLPHDRARTVQVVLAPTSANGSAAGATFQLISFDAEAEAPEPIIHATGTVSRLTQRSAVGIDLAGLRQRCDGACDVAAFYSRAAADGLALVTSGSWLVEVHRGNGEALGQLQRPAGADTGAGHLLPPELLQACFHMAGAIGEGEPPLLLPTEIERLRLHRSAAGDVWWCHVRQDDAQRWTFHLLDTQGELVAEMTGVAMTPATPKALLGEQVWHNWLYDLVWRQQPFDAAGESVIIPSQAWLLLADEGGVGQVLAEQLRARGDSVTMVYAGDAYQQVDAQTFHIRPHRVDDYEELLAAVPAVQGVVHLWSLDVPPMDSANLMDATRHSCGSVLHLVQALEGQSPQLSGLWLITQDARSVQPADRGMGVAQAPLWGMSRTIVLEHPALNCVTIDLDREMDSDEQAAMLYTEITTAPPAAPREEQVALRRDGRYVARLAPYETQSAPDVQIRSDAAYLITGGLGGVGLRVARWLVEQGARHLVLMGRSQPGPQVQQQLDELTALGAQIRVARADVTDRRQLEALLATIEEAHPLRGIIHAADVLDGALLVEQEWAQFANVLAPKVEGAWHLHELTQALPLDFFVLFSSISSLFGAVQLSHYSAANTFLDALACHRRAQGVPALSINCAGWAGAGMDTKLDLGKGPVDFGQGLISPDQGVRVLGALLAQDATQVAVLPIDWRRYAEQVPPSALWAELVDRSPQRTETGHQEVAEEDVNWISQLQSVPDEERRERLHAAVERQIAALLGMRPSEVPVDQPLIQLGLDSLMALQLRNQLQAMFDLEFSLPMLLGDGSVEMICREVDKHLSSGEWTHETKHVTHRRNVSASPTAEAATTSNQKVIEGVL